MSIILENVYKWLHKRPLISNVSLEVQSNELFVLLGGSGSGKSTLLRIIAGLISADKGKVIIGGKDVTALPPQARNIGFVFQNYSVFRHMTVSENIEFGLKIQEVGPEERQKRSAELMDLVNLTGLGARYTNQLSGGQQQRVALARALAYSPKILLLDEPFGALDVKIRAQLRKSLKDIQRQLKMTTILVTHDQEEAFELADKVGVIDFGQLLETGTPEALYHRPQKEFTATFIGGGNVLVGRKDGDQIKLGATSLPVPKNAPMHDEKVPVRLLFRPETVRLQETPFGPTQHVNTLGKGIVKESTFSGPLQRIILEISALQGVQPLMPEPVYGQHTTLIAATRPGVADKQHQFKVGQTLWVGLEDYHVLDPSGLKIMAYTDEQSSGAAAAFAFALGCKTRGSVTLLAVIDKANMLKGARERLEAIAHEWRPELLNMTTTIRSGNVIEEILNEAHHEHYEVCVLDKQVELLNQTNIWQQLLNAGLPVLIVQQPHDKVCRILIAIAAGEPGKDDILFGGRIAKLAGATVTIFHVTRKDIVADEEERIQRYLLSGKASLEALGISTAIKLKEDNQPVVAINSEMQSGNYDLLVIGAPAPKAAQRIIWSDLSMQLISQTSRPVLVVPMLHG